MKLYIQLETTYITQFDNEPLEQMPDPNKKYFLNDYEASTGFTYLFKLLWLIDKRPELICKISEQKKDINTSVNNCTALQFVCRNYKSDKLPQVVKMLIKFGAIVNDDNYYQPALHFACTWYESDKLLEVVTLLIKAKADVNMKYKGDITCLHLVCSNYISNKLPEVIQLLINAGIDVNAKTRYGETALFSICRNYMTGRLQNIMVKSISVLIKACVDLSVFEVRLVDNHDVYDAVVEYRKHDRCEITRFMPYLDKEQNKLLCCFEQFKIAVGPITILRDESYYSPYNIGSLLCEHHFASNQNTPYYSNKLHFLFDKKMILQMNDLLGDIIYYFDGYNISKSIPK